MTFIEKQAYALSILNPPLSKKQGFIILIFT
jgi:hypothetical protein